MASQRFVANRPFGYGDLQLDRGQVFELAGFRNDEKLVRLNYCAEAPKGLQAAVCSECGAGFVGDAERAAHGSDRHRTRELSPLEEDQRFDRQERMLAEVAPLALENTAASRR